MIDKPSSEDGPGTVTEAVGYGAFNVLFFLMISYPGASLIRELLGWGGLAISPLLAAVVVWPISIAIVYSEPRMQVRPWWPRVEKAWRWAGSALYTCPPLILALTYAMPVGGDLPAGAPTVLSLSPLVVLFGFFVLRRRWRDRKGSL
ncbi:hypothetical protein FGW37_22385 [Streptomyces rectiverticillatus]|uniref:hypothetical protein n=1 Tax=Streptomyces rectiverticillatus TaxID=173860 RepID=UPI0015C35F57|nr:hypothetical protein [Streptomyces rectiverticillatus]QLE73960.1 hypothetical protein FGW37_22385 [Streptomyces rectiverticillatus]